MEQTDDIMQWTLIHRSFLDYTVHDKLTMCNGRPANIYKCRSANGCTQVIHITIKHIQLKYEKPLHTKVGQDEPPTFRKVFSVSIKVFQGVGIGG